MWRKSLLGVLFLVLLTAFSSSCQKSNTKATPGTSGAATTPTNAQTATQTAAAPVATTTEEPTTASMIAGDWVSDDDHSAGLSISDSSFANTQGGKIVGEGSYIIADAAATTKDGPANPKGKYITVFGEGPPTSFYVISLDANALSLSYVGRGNTLNYSRPNLSAP